jgi:4-oxalocrotonate tautomerase
LRWLLHVVWGFDMPILNVQISQPASTQMTQQVANALLDLTTRILRKTRDVTAITVSYVPPAQWVIAGRTLAEQGKNSFYFDIKVTDSTNTKDEKAAYVTACFEAMAQLLPNLHEESYIFVHDVRADAYGYGGQTQEFRYVAAKLTS